MFAPYSRLRREPVRDAIAHSLVSYEVTLQRRERINNKVCHHASEDGLAPRVQVRGVLLIVAPVVFVGRTLADGLHVLDARRVEVDSRGAGLLSSLESGKPLVVQRVDQFATLEDAARERGHQKL